MGHTHSMRALREVRQAIQKHLTVHGARGGVAHATHASPPALMGQLLHLFEALIASGVPAFYTLHVWAHRSQLKELPK
jgi:hypothetical protein